jgi:chromatin structure-remodeling complex subunit RSC9
MNGTYGSGGAISTLANYEPRPISALTVKAVASPANNQQWFKDQAKRQRDALRRNRGIPITRGMMLPGTGYPGPNIYIRCLYALQSAVPAEVKYALHHLVKISHERGDKFRFDQFVNLADNLMSVVCSVSTLFYNHPGWQYSWKDEDSCQENLLNQLNGTSNLLGRIKSFKQVPLDTLHTEEWNSTMSDVSSASLVLRNMVILEENANYLSAMPLVRDMMTIVLQLPKCPDTVEIKYYALEMAEQLTRFWALTAVDPLYISLIKTVENNIYDRGMIITGLRALSRISMDLEVTNRLQNIPHSLLTHIYQWLLVEDEDLRGACLDFLYQYTAVTENVQSMVEAMDTESLVDVLMQFLMLGAVRIPVNQESEVKQQAPHSAPASVSTSIPKLAPSIVEKLCQIADSKEQSSAWYVDMAELKTKSDFNRLRSCFIEDLDGEITQLELWSAYNEAFNSLPGEAQLMVAKDFITNVTNVFPKAVARVVPHEHDRSRSKYTMKGISPRAVPLDFRGRPYIKCMWRIPVTPSTESTPPLNGVDSLHKDCDLWFSPSNAEEMWNHIVEAHLEVPRDTDNPRKFNDSSLRGTDRRFACLWAGCSRIPPPGIEDAHKVCVHVKIHLPDSGPGAAARAKYTRDANAVPSEPKLDMCYMNTPMDESGHPIGLPLAGMLVLRNLARQMLKTDGQNQGNNGLVRDSLVEKHFALHQERIFEVMTYNYSLRHYTPEFIQYVSKGMEKAQKKPRLSTD